MSVNCLWIRQRSTRLSRLTSLAKLLMRALWPLLLAMLVAYTAVMYSQFLTYRGVQQTRFDGFEVNTSDVFFSVLAVVVTNLASLYWGYTFAATMATRRTQQRLVGQVLQRCATLQTGLFMLTFLHPDKAWFAVSLSSSYSIGACTRGLLTMCASQSRRRAARPRELDEQLFQDDADEELHLPSRIEDDADTMLEARVHGSQGRRD
jgi:hypothetical protein